MHWRDVVSFKLNKKNTQYLLMAVLMLALVVLSWPILFSSGSSSKDAASTATSAFDPKQETAALEKILSSISGAGQVKVMITYAGDVEKVPVYDNTTTSSTVDSDSGSTTNESKSTKTVSGSGDVVVLTEKRPEVVGVVVVAKGANSLSVKLALSRAVQTALNVEASKVEVFEMNP